MGEGAEHDCEAYFRLYFHPELEASDVEAMSLKLSLVAGEHRCGIPRCMEGNSFFHCYSTWSFSPDHPQAMFLHLLESEWNNQTHFSLTSHKFCHCGPDKFQIDKLIWRHEVLHLARTNLV